MFKVGDRVYNIAYGYGTVMKLGYGQFPLMVTFDIDRFGTIDCEYSFTLQGKFLYSTAPEQDLCPPVKLRWRPNVTASGLLMGYTARYKDKVISLHFNSGVMSIVENGKIKPITMKELRSMLNET